MSKKTARILAIILMLVLAFPLEGNTVVSAKQTTENTTSAKLVRCTFTAADITIYGNIFLSVSCKDFLAAGYRYGDVVKVKINGKKYRVPFVSNYSDVDSGKPALLARESHEKISLAINMGSFASYYGLATKTTHDDGAFEWKLTDENKTEIKVSIWLKIAGGYADEYMLHKLEWSNERSDYPDLIDEQYANFREVTTTGMGRGTLYRTSSPVNPANNRNTYADNALRDAGVKTVVNLADTEDELKAFEGFADTYYSTTKYITLSMDMDFQTDAFREKLADGLRFMAENSGPYAIHCKEGKDRAGYVAALLECLMGASYDEVIEDYMTSFYNYFGVTKEDARYEVICNSNIIKALKKSFTFTKKDKKKDLATRNLSKCAEKYLKKIGLTEQEIKALKKNLSKDAVFVDKNVPVKLSDGSITSLKLRFYTNQPNIPYIGIKRFMDFKGSNELTCTKDDSGKYVFENSLGMKAVADPENGTIFCDDWANFHNAATPYVGDAKALKDSNCEFIRISSVEYEGTPQSVLYDLKKYGLKMYSDENDVYMSTSLASNIFSEIDTAHFTWDGAKGYYGRLGEANALIPEFVNSKIIKKMVSDNKRPQDIVSETYKELCFNIDYFYGHPGVAVLDSAIKEKGLDQALTDLGPEGKELISDLKSEVPGEYYYAMTKLFLKYLDDKGHTVSSDILNLYYMYFYLNSSMEEMNEFNDLLKNYLPFGNNMLYSIITNDRVKIWGDDLYHEYGNTAVIRLVDFMPDEDGWVKFYNGEGELPKDAVGTTIAGLQKASGNPKIKNILFDLSTNNGGSSDVLSYILILTTGENRLNGFDKINGQHMVVTFEADTNLDGVIDEKDKETVYDQFNYGVLTSRQSFSCGNLFPIVMQEEGAVLIGEPTGGGSCCVQIAVQPDGLVFNMSSAQWALIEENGTSVEDGCKTDIQISHRVTRVTVDGVESVNVDYSPYFDDKKLNKLMNDWFAEEQKEAA